MGRLYRTAAIVALLLAALTTAATAQTTVDICSNRTPQTVTPGVPLTALVCADILNDDGTQQRVDWVRLLLNDVLVWEGRASRGTYTYDPTTGLVPFVAGPFTVTSGPAVLSGALGVDVSTTAPDGSVVINEKRWSASFSVTLTTGSTPAPTCTVSLAIPSEPVPATGLTTSIPLAASASSCAWSVGSSATWLQLTPTFGTGSSAVALVVAPNPNTTARVASIALSGVMYSVTQQAAVAPPPPPPPTSDTTAPDVAVRVQRSGNSTNYTVTATTRATDVVRVDFFVDGQRRAMLSVAPFVAKVSITARGSHVVRADMLDAAGNVGTASTTVVR